MSTKHRIRKLVGGLNSTDYTAVGTNTNFRFENREYVQHFRDFHFGTPERTAKWLELLNVAYENNVIVYILTAGDRQGIIRTLQLMELDNYIVNVLTTNRNFPLDQPDGANKYEIISNIVGNDCMNDKTIGILLDDSDLNKDFGNKCGAIKFVDSKNFKLPKIRHLLKMYGEFRPIYSNPENKITQLSNVFNNISRLEDKINLIDMKLLDDIIRNIINKTYNILFIDFDQTFQIYEGSLPFNNKVQAGKTYSDIMKTQLQKVGINIIEIPI